MGQHGRTDEELIALLHNDTKQGWILFLEQYSNTILRTIRQFSFDYDECMEIYVYVCEKLSQKNCARLKQFKGEGNFGKCQFSTWLIASVLNFCRQWLRQTTGRKRLFEAIKHLSQPDQTIFNLYYWQGYQQSEIAEILSNQSKNQITEAEVYQGLLRINATLTKKNKWKMIVGLLRRMPPLSIDSFIEEGGEIYDFQKSIEVEAGPEKDYDKAELSELIKKALKHLSEEELNILRLKFENNLSAREIALVLKIEKYKNVYLKLEAIIDKIKNYLEDNGYDLGEFDAMDGKLQLLEQEI